MTLRSNAPIIPSIVLEGTIEDQEMADVYYLEFQTIVCGREMAQKITDLAPPLTKFLIYSGACARAPKC